MYLVLNPPCKADDEEDDAPDGVHQQTKACLHPGTISQDQSRPEDRDRVPVDDRKTLQQPQTAQDSPERLSPDVGQRPSLHYR
uniref:Uncharacterized protein n=1 Tax=Lepeophtheirus salmonis TaxID=72036 RepID=A0A0K2U3Z7_LEPSM